MSDRLPFQTRTRFCPRWTTAEEADPTYRKQATTKDRRRRRRDEWTGDERTRGRNESEPSAKGRWMASQGTGRSHGRVVESARAICTLHASATATKRKGKRASAQRRPLSAKEASTPTVRRWKGLRNGGQCLLQARRVQASRNLVKAYRVELTA